MKSLILIFLFFGTTYCAYNYSLVLHDSLLFYEAQRSGKLPSTNRIKWRGDSMLDDKGDSGEDLTGGYFDAGDFVKFGFPMAATVTVIAYGLIDYEDAFKKANEYQNGLDMIKWGTDYFLKCAAKDGVFYGQVGDGNVDHAWWGRPEDWPKDKPRTPFKVTSGQTASDLLGETAAALAASSIVFKSNATYSKKLLDTAVKLYDWANTKRGKYVDAITNAKSFYDSYAYGDELAWGAAWLFKATGDKKYKDQVDKDWTEFSLEKRATGFSWDDKQAGVQLLMYQLTKEDKYKEAITDFCSFMVKEEKKTPKGLLWLPFSEWGSLRHASNVAFICLSAANAGINKDENIAFGLKQIGYALGDTGHSYVCGFGTNPPTQPHHRAASCPNRPAVCDWNAMNSQTANPQVLTGALVGGPGPSDDYVDKRSDYQKNEVAMDYNSGFTVAAAALLHFNK